MIPIIFDVHDESLDYSLKIKIKIKIIRINNMIYR